MKRPVLLIAALLLGIGLWQTGEAAWINAKAWLAYGLIDHAWQRTLAGEREVAPWPDADFWPVAKLRFPAQGRELVVLSNATGRTLAFGPGQISGTALSESTSHAVIAGHRDTHFAILRTLEVGEVVELENSHGAWTQFRVMNRFVLTGDESPFLSLPAESVLTLLTCYSASPLGGMTGWLVLEAQPETTLAGNIEA